MRYRFSLLPFAVRFLLGSLLLLLSVFIQLAHAADAELRIETHLSETSPAAGETFTYSIRYRCAGISSLYCTAPRITTTIPEIRENAVNAAKKIAVIGGGPAGLSCAYFLARLGYKPTIVLR